MTDDIRDLVARLQKYGTGTPDMLLLMREAANALERQAAETERLQDSNEKLMASNRAFMIQGSKDASKIARLSGGTEL